MELHYKVAINYLSRKEYTEAEAQFNESNFNPTDLLNDYFPDYTPGGRGDGAPNYTQESLKFLLNIMKSKRNKLLAEYQNPEHNVVSRVGYAEVHFSKF